MKKTTILCVMAALCQKKLKAEGGKLTTFLLIILVLGLSIRRVNAQNDKQQAATLKGLQVGDQLPEVFWKQQHRFYSAGKLVDRDLSAYRGKLLVLDFWATWCGSCLEAFPKVLSLQNKYKDKFAVLTITAEPFAKINGKLMELKPIFDVVPTLVGEQAMYSYFSFKLIPSYVWISADGVFMGITGADGFAEQQLIAAIKGEGLGLSSRKEIDLSYPLLDNAGVLASELSYRATLQPGLLAGVGSAYTERKEGKVVRGKVVTNASLSKLYLRVAARLRSTFSSKLVFKEFTGIDPIYNMELIVPAARAAELDRLMLELLNGQSPFHGGYEKRLIACLVLRPNGSLLETGTEVYTNRLADKLRPFMVNAPLSDLVSRLNTVGLSGPSLFVVDGSDGKGRFNLILDPSLSEISALQHSLATQGISAVLEKKELEVFVIKDRTSDEKI